MMGEVELLCAGIVGYKLSHFGENVPVYKAYLRVEEALISVTLDYVTYNNIEKPLPKSCNRKDPKAVLRLIYESDPVELFINRGELPHNISGWPVKIGDNIKRDTDKFVVTAEVIEDDKLLGYEIVYVDGTIKYITEQAMTKYAHLALNDTTQAIAIKKSQMHPVIITTDTVVTRGNYGYTLDLSGYPTWKVSMDDPDKFNPDEQIELEIHGMLVDTFDGTYSNVDTQILKINVSNKLDTITFNKHFHPNVVIIDLSSFNTECTLTALEDITKVGYTKHFIVNAEAYNNHGEDTIARIIGEHTKVSYVQGREIKAITKANILGLHKLVMLK